MNEDLALQNRLKEIRQEKKLSQSALAEMVGVSRNTISSIETGQFCPTAKLALVLCVALEKKFEVRKSFTFKRGRGGFALRAKPPACALQAACARFSPRLKIKLCESVKENRKRANKNSRDSF